MISVIAQIASLFTVIHFIINEKCIFKIRIILLSSVIKNNIAFMLQLLVIKTHWLIFNVKLIKSSDLIAIL